MDERLEKTVYQKKRRKFLVLTFGIYLLVTLTAFYFSTNGLLSNLDFIFILVTMFIALSISNSLINQYLKKKYVQTKVTK